MPALTAPNMQYKDPGTIHRYNNELIDTLLKDGKVEFTIDCHRDDNGPDNLLLFEKDARTAKAYLLEYLVGHVPIVKILDHRRAWQTYKKEYNILFLFHKDAGTVYGKITPVVHK